MLQLMEQSQKLMAAREAREHEMTPREDRNRKFLNHFSTFLEPIDDEQWHEFTTEVQGVANRYSRKRPAPAAAGAPPQLPIFHLPASQLPAGQSSSDTTIQTQLTLLGQQPNVLSYFPQQHGQFRTGTTPPQQGFRTGTSPPFGNIGNLSASTLLAGSYPNLNTPTINVQSPTHPTTTSTTTSETSDLPADVLSLINSP